MSEDPRPDIGTIAWVDLTVGDAERVRDFYAQVIGWGSQALDMGGYSDFCMTTPGDGKTVAGVCHARGANAALPPLWLMYVLVADIDSSVETCRRLGGKVLTEIRGYGAGDRYCMIADPAGAVLALYQKGAVTTGPETG